MRRITPVLLLVVMIQLTTGVEIAVAKFFPKAPTKAFGNGAITQIAYSPDGDSLAIAGSQGVFLYEPETLAQVAHLAKEVGIILSIAFSPDGTLLVSGGMDANIRLWNIETHEQIHAFTAHNSGVNSVDFGPDGIFLASSSSDDTVHVWDIEKKRQVVSIDTQNVAAGQIPRQVIFSPNGSLVAIALSRGKVILWDFQTQKICRQIDDQRIFPLIAFSLDGKTLLSIASTDNRGDLKFWDVETGKQFALQKNTQNQLLTTHPNRNLVASFNWWHPTPVRIWDVGQKTERAQFPVDGSVHSLAFDPVTDQLALITGGTTIQIWDIATQKLVRKKETHTGGISSLTISPNGETLATSHNDYSVRLWDIERGVERVRLLGHTTIPDVLAFSPDEKMLASEGFGMVHIWDVAHGTERVRFQLTVPLNFVFSPDSRKLIVANDLHTVQVWDIDERKVLVTLQGEDGDGRGIAAKLAISPDGKHLVSTEASTAIHLWNFETLRRRSLLRGHLFRIGALAFSPDGQLLASGDRENVIIWDIAKKKQIATFKGSHPKSMTFSPDGQYLLLETRRRLGKITHGEVIAFRWRDGTEVDRLTFKSPGVLSSVAVSQNGKQLITSGTQILLWDVNLPSLAIEPMGKQLTLWGDVKQTALFQNYPNPFNPETWIPYQLASDSVVTLTIYNLNGERIRQIDLGEKPAGIYQTKADAIHWNGKTDKGESAPSGIYFYTLDAAAHTHSRKMILLK